MPSGDGAARMRPGPLTPGMPRLPSLAGLLASISHAALDSEASGGDASAGNAVVEGVASQAGECAPWPG